MIVFSLAVVAGLVLLMLSAERFVDYAAGLSAKLGVSPLLIGMVIVGLGTSTPEVLVSVLAALNGNPNLALGNVIGSNITNIGLILGMTALLIPVAFRAVILKREMLILIAVSLVPGALMIDHTLSRQDGIMLLLLLAVFFWFSFRQSLRGDLLPNSLPEEEEEEEPASSAGVFTTSIKTLLALAALIIAARVLVWGAVGVATALGVSDLVIGLTILAVGTSLPELSSSLAAARKSQHDMVIGAILGSNIFNILAVLGITALITPIAADPPSLWRDWPVMMAFTLALAVFSLDWACGRTKPLRQTLQRDGRIHRLLALILLLAYGGYMVLLMIDW